MSISKLLYGPPCWEPNMRMTTWKKLDVVHRRIGIKKINAYISVFYAKIVVEASTPSLRLKVRERTVIYNQGDKLETRRDMLSKWQESWETSTTVDMKRWVSIWPISYQDMDPLVNIYTWSKRWWVSKETGRGWMIQSAK